MTVAKQVDAWVNFITAERAQLVNSLCGDVRSLEEHIASLGNLSGVDRQREG